ncbi:MAG: magnesium transporter [Bacteroidales bacterium]|nr:magnesium transporter [Bacteroidales bacterium]
MTKNEKIVNTSFEITREYLDNLHQIIENKNEEESKKILAGLHAADIAEIYKIISTEEAKFLYFLLDGEKAADVISYLEEDERDHFLKVIPSKVIAQQFIEHMDSDDAADIIADLSDEKKEEVLSFMDDIVQAGDIVDLLNYDENTAGGLMAKEMISVNENWDINTCLKEMRKQAEDVDEVYYVYVVDDDRKLKGTLSLKKMLLKSSSSKVKNIYNKDVIAVKTDTSSEEVANIMDRYDLVSLPVIDSLGRLVGRITIDDVVDLIREEAEKDYQMISGITEDVETTDKVFLLTRARLPWLAIGMIGGIFSAKVISLYESDLRIYPEMAFFIPLITAMGGNVGVQSSAIIVQSIANKTLSYISPLSKLMKELMVALTNGIILSSLIFAYNFFFSDSYALTFTVSIALFSVIIFASIFGTFIPLTLHRIKIDPALATGPFITTSNDIIGLVIYLLIGRAFHGVF